MGGVGRMEVLGEGRCVHGKERKVTWERRSSYCMSLKQIETVIK